LLSKASVKSASICRGVSGVRLAGATRNTPMGDQRKTISRRRFRGLGESAKLDAWEAHGERGSSHLPKVTKKGTRYRKKSDRDLDTDARAKAIGCGGRPREEVRKKTFLAERRLRKMYNAAPIFSAEPEEIALIFLEALRTNGAERGHVTILANFGTKTSSNIRGRGSRWRGGRGRGPCTQSILKGQYKFFCNMKRGGEKPER